MGGHQPHLYEPMGQQDNRFPYKPFDPKAVTRASFQPQQLPLKNEGPLITFNRHPDAHVVLTHRSNDYRPLGSKTKALIKAMRVLQLVLRALELVGATGILALYVLMTNVATVVAWMLRIASAIAVLHCSYGIYHLSRRAGGRAPASSAAYQVFAGVSDLCILPIYAFGVYAARSDGATWSSLLDNPLLLQYFVPAAEYTALGAGALHLVSLCISIWLGIIFRKIAHMPPDLNPLEDRFTSRVKHKRNKSSIATTSTEASDDRRSAALGVGSHPYMPHEDFTRPPTIPFMRTRANSSSSLTSRDSRIDLPSRHYQVVPENASVRSSAMSTNSKRMSGSPTELYSSYSELPMREDDTATPRSLGGERSGRMPAQQRVAKFTETWSATDSLISRTQRRQRQMRATTRAQAQAGTLHRPYEALNQRYDSYDNRVAETDHGESELVDHDDENVIGTGLHPQPLRSNPPRTESAHLLDHQSPPSGMTTSSSQSSGTYDISDEKHAPPPAPMVPQHRHELVTQEKDFFSKPYGQLKPATPPVVIGRYDRQVSTGNDMERNPSATFGRRRVSGKLVEEGHAGYRHSRYQALNG